MTENHWSWDLLGFLSINTLLAKYIIKWLWSVQVKTAPWFLWQRKRCVTILYMTLCWWINGFDYGNWWSQTSNMTRPNAMGLQVNEWAALSFDSHFLRLQLFRLTFNFMSSALWLYEMPCFEICLELFCTLKQIQHKKIIKFNFKGKVLNSDTTVYESIVYTYSAEDTNRLLLHSVNLSEVFKIIEVNQKVIINLITI